LGYEEAEKFVVKYVYSYIAHIPQASIQSYKTLLQEYIQQEDKETPIYKDNLLSHETKGNKTIFASEVLRGGEVVGYGE
jgi:dsRNA-specific ribonuclease